MKSDPVLDCVEAGNVQLFLLRWLRDRPAQRLVFAAIVFLAPAIHIS
jgi:hypothetical protein